MSMRIDEAPGLSPRLNPRRKPYLPPSLEETLAMNRARDQQLADEMSARLSAQSAEMLQPRSMQFNPPPQGGDSSMGSSLGSLAGTGVNYLRRMRAPELKPDGSSPFDKLPTANLSGPHPDGSSPFDSLAPAQLGGGGGFMGGVKRLFHFRDGGNLSSSLRRAGDVAEVGEVGPELARRRRDGSIEIVPLEDVGLAPRLVPQEPVAPVVDVPLPRLRIPDPQPDPEMALAPRLTQTVSPRAQLLSDLVRQHMGEAGAAVAQYLSPTPQAPRLSDEGMGRQAAPPEDPGLSPRLLRQERAAPVAESQSPTLRQPVVAAPEPPPQMAIPRLRPEDVRASKNLPAPGEEAANDARFNLRLRDYPGLGEPETGASTTAGLPPAGVTYGNSREDMQPTEGFARRQRVARPIDFLEHRVEEDLTRPVVDHNGGVRSTLIGAGRGFLRGVARTGSLAGGVGGAASGAITHGLDHSLDERYAANELTQDDASAYGAARGIEAAGLKAEGARSDVRYKNAAAGYAEARPEIEAAKIAETHRKAEEARIFRALTSLRGQRLDPSNPRHAKLIADADAAGIPLDAESFNNSRGNLVRYVKADPDSPEKTIEVERNMVTGQETVLGQKGFQATRGADGRTTAEVKSDEDRDRGFKALERERNISNELRRASLNLSGQRFDLSKAQYDNRLSEDTRKELKSANDLIAEAERYQEDANSVGARTKYIDPDTGKEMESAKRQIKRDEYQARAAALRRRAIANYGYLFADGDKISTEQFRQLFPSLGGNFSGEAQRLGLTLTDDPMQGPVGRSAVPRRGAPAAARSAGRSASPVGGSGRPSAPSTDKTHVSRAKARQTYPELRGKSDAEIDEAIKAQGLIPMP